MPGVVTSADGSRRRRLRAIFAADAANFTGQVSSDETGTLEDLWRIRRLARIQLDANGGWLFGMPGDGIFALFESAVDAVRCALLTQATLADAPNSLKLRIGVHLGEVLFKDELPFGEALVIAARLESLAEPGGILVSAAVMDAVAPRISATFERCGVKSLKHSPRRITTFSVKPHDGSIDLRPASIIGDPFDTTVELEAAATELTQTSSRSKTKRAAAQRDAAALDTSSTVMGKTTRSKRAPQTPTPLAARAAPFDATGRLGKTRGLGERGNELSTTRGSSRKPATLPPQPNLPALRRPTVPDRVDQRSRLDALGKQLSAPLTTYIGPFARMVIKREVAEAADAPDLVLRLAREIGAKRDREAFLKLAKALIERPQD